MSRAVGGLRLEPNKNLVDNIMMSVPSVGKSEFYLSSTELEFQANMVVIGKQAFVFSHSGKYSDVQDFDKQVKGLPLIRIVDALIAYNCTYSGKTSVSCGKCPVCYYNGH